MSGAAQALHWMGQRVPCLSPTGSGKLLSPVRDGDWGLRQGPMNEEFPVSASHQLTLIKFLPFVHAACRYYGSDDLLRFSDQPMHGLSVIHVTRCRCVSSCWCAKKMKELECLEEVKVVTRSPPMITLDYHCKSPTLCYLGCGLIE